MSAKKMSEPNENPNIVNVFLIRRTSYKDLCQKIMKEENSMNKHAIYSFIF